MHNAVVMLADKNGYIKLNVISYLEHPSDIGFWCSFRGPSIWLRISKAS